MYDNYPLSQQSCICLIVFVSIGHLCQNQLVWWLQTSNFFKSTIHPLLFCSILKKEKKEMPSLLWPPHLFCFCFFLSQWKRNKDCFLLSNMLSRTSLLILMHKWFQIWPMESPSYWSLYTFDVSWGLPFF